MQYQNQFFIVIIFSGAKIGNPPVFHSEFSGIPEPEIIATSSVAEHV